MSSKRKRNSKPTKPTSAQTIAELEAMIKRLEAEKAGAMVVDPSTGEISNMVQRANDPLAEYGSEIKTTVPSELSKSPLPVQRHPEQGAETNPTFQLKPGDGWLFYQVGRDNVHIWQGHIRLDDMTELQAQARLDVDAKVYHCTLREFGGTWPIITEFDMPMLGDQSYVDGEFKLPLKEPIQSPNNGTVTHRTYKVRMMKKVTLEKETILRMQLPQVQRAVRQRSVPM